MRGWKMKDNSRKKYFSVKEAAEYTGMSPSWIANKVRSGEVPSFPMGEGKRHRRLIDIVHLDPFFQKERAKAEAADLVRKAAKQNINGAASTAKGRTQ